jgi:hypothetical protein
MGIKTWIGDITNPNNIHPRILFLLITIIPTLFVLILAYIRASQNYSNIPMLCGILFISRDKIFGKSWLANRLNINIKNGTIHDFLSKILHFGIVYDYLGLLGTGLIISAVIFEINISFIFDNSMSLTIFQENSDFISSQVARFFQNLFLLCFVIFILVLIYLDRIFKDTRIKKSATRTFREMIIGLMAGSLAVFLISLVGAIQESPQMLIYLVPLGIFGIIIVYGVLVFITVHILKE